MQKSVYDMLPFVFFEKKEGRKENLFWLVVYALKKWWHRLPVKSRNWSGRGQSGKETSRCIIFFFTLSDVCIKVKKYKKVFKNFQSLHLFFFCVWKSETCQGATNERAIALEQWSKGCIYKGYCNLGHIFSWDLEEFQICRFIFLVLNCKVRH